MPWNADRSIYTTDDGRVFTAAEIRQKQLNDPMGNWGDENASGNPFAVEGGVEQLGASIQDRFQNLGTMLGLIPKRVGLAAPGAGLDTTQADQERARLGPLLQQLQQQAETGGGAWEKTLKDATGQASSSAMALGQSMPGVGYQSALRNIGNAQSAVSQRAVGQANTLREQSKVAGQNQLTDLLGGMGEQDINQADASARVNQGVRTLNNELSKNANDTTMGTVKAVADVVFSDGGKVPGKAEVFGDDERNDTVAAMLSPGEIVIPRSHAGSPEQAAEFVRALQARKAVPHFAEGGQTGLSNTGAVFQDFGNDGDAPSVQNGGLLNTKPFDDLRPVANANETLLAKRAAGEGPSVAPQQMQSSSDANIGAAMQAMAGRGAVPAGDVLQSVGAAQQGAAGDAAATTANEQKAGQSDTIRAVLGQRARELAMAHAQQQAAWRNTQLNAGLGLAQQAQLRGILAGVGQAATAFGGMDEGGGGDFSGSDTNTPSFDAGVGEMSSPEEWADPYAHGGEVHAKKAAARRPASKAKRASPREPTVDVEALEPVIVRPDEHPGFDVEALEPAVVRREWAQGGEIPDPHEKQRAKDFLAALRRRAA